MYGTLIKVSLKENRNDSYLFISASENGPFFKTGNGIWRHFDINI
jgi:hypothetical protein